MQEPRLDIKALIGMGQMHKGGALSFMCFSSIESATSERDIMEAPLPLERVFMVLYLKISGKKARRKGKGVSRTA